MDFKYFSKNGKLLPTSDAVISISNVGYQYGFGVYETIRVTNSIPYFLKEHIERLEESARIIGLEHAFPDTLLYESVDEIVRTNKIDMANLKILLIGGRSVSDASLYIIPLNPLFPDKKLYTSGVKCITYAYQRPFPHAKTLNMLQSYLAYKKARAMDAYDALLLDNEGNVTEGTRTNIFCLKGSTLISPPEEKILLGITREAVIKTAKKTGFSIEERNVSLSSLSNYDAVFLTSTSSKILPISEIDSKRMRLAETLSELMKAFDAFLKNCNGKM